MFIDGITIPAGSEIQETVLNNDDRVTSLPGTVDNGRVIELTQQDGANAPGVYEGIGGQWVAQADTIAERIDQALVNINLNGKADITYVDAGLAAKADTSTVNSALALKANITYVDAGLAAKADTSTVNSALALKADTSTVNSALALKANSSDVTTSLASKADSSAITALQFYDIALNITGKPDVGAIVIQVVAPRAFTIPENFVGSKVVAATVGTGATVFTVKRWNAAYTSSTTIGTINIAGGAKTGSFTQNGSGAIPVAVGETIEITAPNPQDSTLANIGITLMTTLS